MLEALTQNTPLTEDEAKQNTSQLIRPKSMLDYIGQSHIKKQMTVCIQAAIAREETLDHVLLHGPPGLGKTSLANVIANEIHSNIHVTSGPVIERSGDLAAILSRLECNDIVFIDEIHRMPPSVEEVLYSAMEDFKIDLMLGEGPAARNIRIDIQPFTLIGATTRAGMLTSPLLDRFGIQHRLTFYNHDDLQTIIMRSASILETVIDKSGAFEIAKRSRGTPRIANRLLKRVRDYASVQNCTIDSEFAKRALDQLEIDQGGLNALDRQYIQVIIEKFNGGPVGIDNIATAIGDAKETLEDVIEPYLIQAGFLMRTSRGRILSDKAYVHFGLNTPNKDDS